MAIARVSGNAWTAVSALSGGSVDGAANGTKIAQTFANNVTAGSLLVAVTSTLVGANETHTFADNNGNTWVLGASRYYSAVGAYFAIGYAANANAGSTRVNVTSASDVNRGLVICEYTGAATASALDGTAVAADSAGSSSNPDPGAITTTQGGIIIGATMYSDGGADVTSSGSYSLVKNTISSSYPIFAQDWVTSAAQTANHPSFVGAKSFWLGLGIAFKDSGGTVPTITDASDENFFSGETAIPVIGTNFGASQGTGTVKISPTNNVADGSAVTQTVTAWTDTQVTITAAQGGLASNTGLYLFVTNNAGASNATGYSVQFGSVSPLSRNFGVQGSQRTLITM